MSWHVISAVYKAKLGGATRKAIAAKLADWADDEGGNIFPSVRRIAEETEVCEPTVQRTLRAFTKEGLLREVKKGGQGPRSTTKYQFDLKAMAALPRTRTGASTKGDTVSPFDGLRVTPTTDKGDTVSPDPSVEPSAGRAPKQVSSIVAEALSGMRDGLIPFDSSTEDGCGEVLPQSFVSAAFAAGVDPRLTAVSQHDERDHHPETRALLHLGRLNVAKNGAAAELSDEWRLPFTPRTIAAIRLLVVDPETLAATYTVEAARKKARGEKIHKPNAYLFRMAQEIVAEREGMSLAAVKGIARIAWSGNRAGTEAAFAAARAHVVMSPDIDAEELKRRNAMPRPKAGDDWRNRGNRGARQ